MNQDGALKLLKRRLFGVVRDNFPSVNSFANQSELLQPVVHRWLNENDNTKPSYEIFIKLAEFLPNLNLRALLLGGDQTSSEMVVSEDSVKYGNTAFEIRCRIKGNSGAHGTYDTKHNKYLPFTVYSSN